MNRIPPDAHETSHPPGALVAAVVVFIWQTISHMALPWHQTAFSEFKDADVVQKVLEDNADGPGMYMVPWADHHDEEAMKQAMEQWDTGFSMFASVRPNGSNSFGESFVQQFVWNFLGAFFIAFLLVKLNLKGTSCKVGTTVFFALFTVVAGILPNWTWWGLRQQLHRRQHRRHPHRLDPRRLRAGQAAAVCGGDGQRIHPGTGIRRLTSLQVRRMAVIWFAHHLT